MQDGRKAAVTFHVTYNVLFEGVCQAGDDRCASICLKLSTMKAERYAHGNDRGGLWQAHVNYAWCELVVFETGICRSRRKGQGSVDDVDDLTLDKTHPDTKAGLPLCEIAACWCLTAKALTGFRKQKRQLVGIGVSV